MVSDMNGNNVLHRVLLGEINGFELTRLIPALKDKDADLLRTICDVVNINQKNNNGDTPLHIAVANCTLECINQLLTLGAQINQPNKMGLSPLHLAVARNDSELIIRLISAGADLNSLGFGSSFHQEVIPLQYAVMMGKLNSLNPLVEVGDINICTTNGDTLMHLATSYYNEHTIEIINFLLSRGVTHHLLTNNRGETPLHLAVKYCEAPIIHRLIQVESDLQARTNTGHTPYDLYKSRMEALKQMCEASKVPFDVEYAEYLKLLTFGENEEVE